MSSSGRAFYYYDLGGRPRRELPLGADYVRAVQKWTELEGGAAKAPAVVTFETVAVRYERDVMPKKSLRTQRDNKAELVQLRKFFGNPPAPLEAMRPLHVRQYMDYRVDAPIRANREKALLSHMWNKAREWGYTDRENPCRGVEGYPEPGRDEYVENDVFAAVYAEADQMTRDAMDLVYLSAQRPGDVHAMSDTQLREGALAMRQGKTGKRLRIRLAGEFAATVTRITARPRKVEDLTARRAAKEAGEVPTRRLVVNEAGQPLTYSGLSQRFTASRERAIAKALEAGNRELATRIARFQLRDLRAKAGTDAADDGGRDRAQRQLGHANSAMTDRYIRNRRGDKVEPTK